MTRSNIQLSFWTLTGTTAKDAIRLYVAPLLRTLERLPHVRRREYLLEAMSDAGFNVDHLVSGERGAPNTELFKRLAASIESARNSRRSYMRLIVSAIVAIVLISAWIGSVDRTALPASVGAACGLVICLVASLFRISRENAMLEMVLTLTKRLKPAELNAALKALVRGTIDKDHVVRH